MWYKHSAAAEALDVQDTQTPQIQTSMSARALVTQALVPAARLTSYIQDAGVRFWQMQYLPRFIPMPTTNARSVTQLIFWNHSDSI